MQQMNRRSAMALGAAAVAGALASSLSPRKAGAAEYRHPGLHRAIEALHDAREEITATHHDWGGHRREAVEAIDHALRHLEVLRDWHE